MNGFSLVQLLLLAVFTLIASPSCVSGSGEDGNGEDRLTIELLRKDRVDGSFVSPERGCGVVFNATEGGLSLSTLSGNRLLSAEGQVGPVRLVTLGNREFIQHREHDGESETVQDYAIPRYHRSLVGNQDHQVYMDVVEKLKKIDPKAHSRVLEKSVRKTLSKCEISLLSDMAMTMGRQGITSRDYPSTLPLYMMASRISSHPSLTYTSQGNSLENRDSGNNDLYHHRQGPERLKRQTCLSDCPPCKDQECLGMCGPGCTCWEWACSNCCYNKGCYYHDLCCRSKPNSLACLMPLSFDCNSKYVCESPKPEAKPAGLNFKFETD